VSSTTDTTTGSAAQAPQPLTDAEERQRHREEARLIRTREAAARKDSASKDGQWALGDRTPLNPNEEMKAAGDPLEVRSRIENLYSKWGFWSIPPGDLRSVEELPRLVEIMLRRGFPEARIRKVLGENFLACLGRLRA